jgi:hypothetical protein
MQVRVNGQKETHLLLDGNVLDIGEPIRSARFLPRGSMSAGQHLPGPVGGWNGFVLFDPFTGKQVASGAGNVWDQRIVLRCWTDRSAARPQRLARQLTRYFPRDSILAFQGHGLGGGYASGAPLFMFKSEDAVGCRVACSNGNMAGVAWSAVLCSIQLGQFDTYVLPVRYGVNIIPGLPTMAVPAGADLFQPANEQVSGTNQLSDWVGVFLAAPLTVPAGASAYFKVLLQLWRR